MVLTNVLFVLFCSFPIGAEPGKYIISYHVQDQQGNSECVALARTVVVKDTLAPALKMSWVDRDTNGGEVHYSYTTAPMTPDVNKQTVSWQDVLAQKLGFSGGRRLGYVREDSKMTSPHNPSSVVLPWALLSAGIVGLVANNLLKQQRAVNARADIAGIIHL
jgi:hypothetical protein